MNMFAQGYLIVGAATLILVLLAMLVHYEASFRLRRMLQRNQSLRRRARIMILLGGLFLAHVAEVAFFGIGGWLLISFADTTINGSLGGLEASPELADFLFLSIASYTTVGFSEAYPLGPIRFLFGIESLIGFMLITWTASLSFLEMQHHWQNMEEDK
ncbi:ion channel [Pseudidiomarina halophila]|nr:ion channel [Pseudidiomarina halophila]